MEFHRYGDLHYVESMERAQSTNFVEKEPFRFTGGRENKHVLIAVQMSFLNPRVGVIFGYGEGLPRFLFSEN